MPNRGWATNSVLVFAATLLELSHDRTVWQAPRRQRGKNYRRRDTRKRGRSLVRAAHQRPNRSPRFAHRLRLLMLGCVLKMCTPLALSFPIFELLTSVTAALIGSLLSHQNVIARFAHGLLVQLESRRALIGYSKALLERHSGANQLTFVEQAPNQRDAIRHAAGR